MGLWGSESSLGWVLRDPVIWLDMPPLSLGQTLRECYGGKNSQQQACLTLNHTTTFMTRQTISDLNRKRKRMVIKIKERVD